MDFCDFMFKFPYRIYEDNSPVEDSSIVILSKIRKWVLGYKYVYVEDILSISDTFYLDSDIDDIIETGFNASLIETSEGQYSCDWSLPLLEKKINDHVKKIEAATSKNDDK